MSLEALLNDDYKVDLEVFEGPLDLLLFLIRRDEVDIYDIPIEKVTAQYLTYLDVMRMLDLNIAGEFLVMAATLMMIKSRLLLPVETRSSEDESDEQWVDPRLDLVRQLIEYKKFKDAAGQLMRLETLRGEVFTYGGEQLLLQNDIKDVSQVLEEVGLFDLLSAFQEVLAHTPMESFGMLEPILWSVPDKMEFIITKIKEGSRIFFSKLFQPESHRNEVIVTFLALLELLRLRQIMLHQNVAFHDILILPMDPEYDGGISVIIGGGLHVES